MSTTPNQPRQPKGVPVSGQFSAKANPKATLDIFNDESDFEISASAPAWLERRRFLDERVEALRSVGYILTTTAPMLVDPRSSAHTNEWWDRHMAAGEYNHPVGGYPQMPDDWTPRNTLGNSLSGHRRTHRVAYAGDNVTMRMPSATAIKSYANANVPGKDAGETFDVPIPAQFPGGEIDGRVRVARSPDGSFATQGLGFTPEQSAYVAEAVQCVLESWRPSRALKDAGDILERRRERAAQLGIAVEPVKSAWIHEMGYDKATSTMAVTTEGKSGEKRVYGNYVPIAAFISVAHSPSPGRAFNRIIRGKTERVDVNECGTCGRTFATPQHRCPATLSTRKRYLPRLASVKEYLARRR